MRFLVLLTCSVLLYSCTTDYQTFRELDKNLDMDKMTFMFYNVENLFDTINDPFSQDDEYTPNSDKYWDSDKYYTKLDRIAEVIDKIDQSDWPAIVGMAEIENMRVLEDLIQNNQIANAGYDIVHFDSPDERGIDMAMLYRKEFMNIVQAKNIGLVFPFNPNIKTRDILYVQVNLFNGENMHLLFNHWPSRREGAEETEPKRLYVASVLKEIVDDIIKEDPAAKIVVMGDFNDYPTDRSIAEVLAATNTNKGLYNLALQLHKDGKGTINHKGDWGMIDQIMVSQSVFEKKGWYLKDKELTIFYRDWLVYKDPKWGDMKPDKTFGGDNYYGGYSDHLPISITFKRQE